MGVDEGQGREQESGQSSRQVPGQGGAPSHEQRPEAEHGQDLTGPSGGGDEPGEARSEQVPQQGQRTGGPARGQEHGSGASPGQGTAGTDTTTRQSGEHVPAQGNPAGTGHRESARSGGGRAADPAPAVGAGSDGPGAAGATGSTGAVGAAETAGATGATGTDAAAGAARRRADGKVPRARSRPWRRPGTRGGDDPTAGPGAAADAGVSDALLVARMREGDATAYEELYRRHATPVRRYARTCCRDAHTAEDLTNEVFARTLQAVRGGKGPESSVRAYLLTSVRHVAAAWARTRRREQLVEDFAVFVQSSDTAVTAAEAETLDLGADVRAMHEAEQTLVVKAFKSLSEADQMLLWHTAVEGAKPQDVAPLLGKSTGATTTAAHRARENLKQAYLQAHVSRARTESGDCARWADRLGAYARGGLRMRAERGLAQHLDQCAQCRQAALEVKDLNEHIRLLVPVALIGWFATAGGAKGLAVLLGGGAAAGGTGAAAAAGAAGAGASGGAAGSAGGSGASGGAAAEGLGAPAKVGIGVGVVAVAGAALAWALAGGGAEPPKKPEARPAAPAPRPPSEKPQQPEKPAPAPVVPERPSPRPEPSAPPAEPEPEPTPRPTPPQERPSPEPTPTPTPTPPEPSHPAPEPPRPEPPEQHQLNQLDWDLLSPDDPPTAPTIRTRGSSWVWQREGPEIAGTRYAHGISVHPDSSVTIDLNRPCTRYAALAGVDDLTAGPGAVRFTVYGDGDRLWQSPYLRRGEAPVPVQVPLTGKRTLRLVVEPRTPLDRPALADWARSRIACEGGRADDAGPGRGSDAPSGAGGVGPERSDDGSSGSDVGLSGSDGGPSGSDSGPSGSDVPPSKPDAGPSKSDAIPSDADVGPSDAGGGTADAGVGPYGPGSGSPGRSGGGAGPGRGGGVPWGGGKPPGGGSGSSGD
ncbi:sigma-70 family RNA polymerase sigma factor [Streptomyces cacaoi]|uniref:sigma-70 family RNA polymerase sigma factor n=1 Tax=Streptomyces cacaoi TaxID=1898 RepID=UPI003145708E